MDLLLYQKKAQQHYQQRKQQEEVEEKLKECTFQPKTLNNPEFTKRSMVTNRQNTEQSDFSKASSKQG